MIGNQLFERTEQYRPSLAPSQALRRTSANAANVLCTATVPPCPSSLKASLMPACSSYSHLTHCTCNVRHLAGRPKFVKPQFIAAVGLPPVDELYPGEIVQVASARRRPGTGREPQWAVCPACCKSGGRTGFGPCDRGPASTRIGRTGSGPAAGSAGRAASAGTERPGRRYWPVSSNGAAWKPVDSRCRRRRQQLGHLPTQAPPAPRRAVAAR